MAKNTCDCCTRDIKVQIYKGSGYCSERCRKTLGLDNSVNFATTMVPRPKPQHRQHPNTVLGPHAKVSSQ